MLKSFKVISLKDFIRLSKMNSTFNRNYYSMNTTPMRPSLREIFVIYQFMTNFNHKEHELTDKRLTYDMIYNLLIRILDGLSPNNKLQLNRVMKY